MSLRARDRVQVLVAPYEGFYGEVAEVRENPKRLIVVIGVLGQSTSVELCESQVQRRDFDPEDESPMTVRQPSAPRRGGSASSQPSPASSDCAPDSNPPATE